MSESSHRRGMKLSLRGRHPAWDASICPTINSGGPASSALVDQYNDPSELALTGNESHRQLSSLHSETSSLLPQSRCRASPGTGLNAHWTWLALASGNSMRLGCVAQCWLPRTPWAAPVGCWTIRGSTHPIKHIERQCHDVCSAMHHTGRMFDPLETPRPPGDGIGAIPGYCPRTTESSAGHVTVIAAAGQAPTLVSRAPSPVARS